MISDNSYLWAWKLERDKALHMHVQHGSHCSVYNLEVTNDGKALECDEW